MIGLVLVGHVDLGVSLRRAAEMLIGPQERLATVGLGADTEPATLRRDLEAAFEAVAHPRGVLILADLYGGSPEATSVEVAGHARTPVEVVAGANLPMLLAALSLRSSMPLSALASHVRKAGREGVVRVPVVGHWPPAAPGPH